MRVYRKTTQHPYCVYLTAEEARELRVEAEIATSESTDLPDLERLMSKLDALLSDPKRERA